MEGKWGYSTNEELYSGECDTKEEAIAEAIAESEDSYTLHVGQYKAVRPEINGYQICEQVGEHAYEQCGEVCIDWLGYVPKEQEQLLTKRLTDVFYDWCKEFGYTPNFFGVENVEMVSQERRCGCDEYDYCEVHGSMP